MRNEKPAPGRLPRYAMAAVAGVLALSAVFVPGGKTGAQTSVSDELNRLKAQVGALEEAVSLQRQKLAEAQAAAKEQVASAAGKPPEVFSTAAWAKDERQPAAGSAEAVDGLLDFVVKTDGAGLVREMEKLMGGGDKGHAVLQDFLHALDKNIEPGRKLTGKYDIAFALTHLAMIEEEGMARLAHAYFAATRKTTRTLLRGHLYNFLPVFLEFHRGRFPDLERDLSAEIFRLVRSGDKRVRMLLDAAVALDFFPAIEVIEERLDAATDFQEYSALILHLGARDDKDAVRVLRKFIIKNMRLRGGAVSQALVSLARMTDPGAEKVFQELTWTKDAFVYSKAIRAYFAVHRHDGFTPEARRYLNSKVGFGDKKSFISQLRQSNPAILAELRATADQLSSQEVREYLLK